jgi:hypothetical protein
LRGVGGGSTPPTNTSKIGYSLEWDIVEVTAILAILPRE